jgi:plasmid stabilization system protein ParE
MPRLIWTPAAIRDLDRLHRFLESKNRDAARRAIASIRQGLALLQAHPAAGRPTEVEGLREWPIRFGAYGYVALYRSAGERVVILAVRHGLELDFPSR